MKINRPGHLDFENPAPARILVGASPLQFII
ncbi:hypothetical protein IWX76_002104 [Pedobacter sp. CAN_A7]